MRAPTNTCSAALTLLLSRGPKLPILRTRAMPGPPSRRSRTPLTGVPEMTQDALAPRPVLTESSTSDSTTAEVAIRDLNDGTLSIPDYQRDADQWDPDTKSLLIESVINNLTIPAFFFEVSYDAGVERNSVVDGQQRLTTLQEFWNNKLRLVTSEDAPYLSPQSVHYAGKTLDELPPAYKQAFKKYRLTVIKLRDLGDLRLETF